jgi:hypothetical protein
MRNISEAEIFTVNGGMMDLNTLWCLNTKIHVSAGAGEAEFDTAYAGWALSKSCPMLFPTNVEGENYATMIHSLAGGFPPPPIFP